MTRPTALASLTALLLLAAPPARAGDEEFYADEEPEEFTALEDVRFGAGGVRMVNVEGVAPSFEVGADFAPWGERLGLRVTLGTAMRVGWGTVGYLAPEIILHPVGRGGRVVPFLAAGLQLGVVSITQEARDPRAPGEVAAALGSETDPGGEPVLEPGPSPLRATLGPQATAGLRLALGRAALELGGRVALVRVEQSYHPTLALLVTVLGPGH